MTPKVKPAQMNTPKSAGKDQNNIELHLAIVVST